MTKRPPFHEVQGPLNLKVCSDEGPQCWAPCDELMIHPISSHPRAGQRGCFQLRDTSISECDPGSASVHLQSEHVATSQAQFGADRSGDREVERLGSVVLSGLDGFLRGHVGSNSFGHNGHTAQIVQIGYSLRTRIVLRCTRTPGTLNETRGFGGPNR